MHNSKFQDILFSRIREKLAPDISISDAVSEVLHISADSAYRRIRGETPLVVDELASLCGHFQISLDQLINNQHGKVVFQNTRIHNEEFNYYEYLQDLNKQLKHLDAFSKRHMIYMSKDLPIFYNFLFKPLATFRYFFWMKVQLSHPDFVQLKFDKDMMPTLISQVSEDLLRTYCNIPCTEIWNIESVNSTISQIEFARTSGYFKNPEDVKEIYDALEATIYHLQEQAEYGCKYMPGEDPSIQTPNLKFFFNRVLLGDNTILVKAGDVNTAYINYGNLSYLVTTDESFCKSLSHDFDNLMRRSTLISGTGERQRNVFFNIFLSKIGERKLNAI